MYCTTLINVSSKHCYHIIPPVERSGDSHHIPIVVVCGLCLKWWLVVLTTLACTLWYTTVNVMWSSLLRAGRLVQESMSHNCQHSKISIFSCSIIYFLISTCYIIATLCFITSLTIHHKSSSKISSVFSSRPYAYSSESTLILWQQLFNQMTG